MTRQKPTKKRGPEKKQTQFSSRIILEQQQKFILFFNLPLFKIKINETYLNKNKKKHPCWNLKIKNDLQFYQSSTLKKKTRTLILVTLFKILKITCKYY